MPHTMVALQILNVLIIGKNSLPFIEFNVHDIMFKLLIIEL